MPVTSVSTSDIPQTHVHSAAQSTAGAQTDPAAGKQAAPAESPQASAQTAAAPDERMSDILRSYGFKATEENRAMLANMLNNGIPLTKENITKMNQAMKLTDSPEQALFLMQNGMRLTKSNAAQLRGLAEGQTRITEQINNLLAAVEGLDDPVLKEQILQILAKVQGRQEGQAGPQPGQSTALEQTARQLAAEAALQAQSGTGGQQGQAAASQTAAGTPGQASTAAGLAAEQNATAGQGTVAQQNAAAVQGGGTASAQGAAAQDSASVQGTAVQDSASVPGTAAQGSASVSGTAAQGSTSVPGTAAQSSASAQGGANALAGQNETQTAAQNTGTAGQPQSAGQNETAFGQNAAASRSAGQNSAAGQTSAQADAQQTAGPQSGSPAASASGTDADTQSATRLAESAGFDPERSGPASHLRPETGSSHRDASPRLSFRLADSTPQDIDQFINSLRDAMTETKNAIANRPEQSPAAERVMREVQSLSEHIDFTAQIKNQLFVQLPIYHNGQETQTALHIYKDGKKGSKGGSGGGAVSALIALETFGMGHFETYVQKTAKSVNCQFRLRDKQVEQLVRAHIHELNALLKVYNYSLDGFSFLPPGEAYTLLDSPKVFGEGEDAAAPEAERVLFDSRV